MVALVGLFAGEDAHADTRQITVHMGNGGEGSRMFANNLETSNARARAYANETNRTGRAECIIADIRATTE